MTDVDEAPQPPGLREDGLKLWKSITDDLDVDLHELVVLAEACYVTDSLAALNEAIVDSPTDLKLLAERRQQQATLMRLMMTLRLKFGDEDAPTQQRGGARGTYRK